jgi:hypothetical protein
MVGDGAAMAREGSAYEDGSGGPSSSSSVESQGKALVGKVEERGEEMIVEKDCTLGRAWGFRLGQLVLEASDGIFVHEARFLLLLFFWRRLKCKKECIETL